MFKRILVLAPHTDDGEFGCGGSMAYFLEQGRDVYYVAFSTAEKSVPEGLPRDILKTEVVEATRKIGIPRENLIIYNHEVRKLNYVRQDILEDLIRIKKDVMPDLVLLPSQNDLHQDHFVVSSEGMRAFKQASILGYEIPWNNITFHTQAFIKLEKAHVEKKIAALKEYKSQSFRSYAAEDFIWSLVKTRGLQIGSQYAETFEVIRWVI